MHKLYVILGPKAATAVFGQRKANTPTKRARSLFGLWHLRALGLLLRRPQNDSDNAPSIVFAHLFVQRNTKSHIALCKSF